MYVEMTSAMGKAMPMTTRSFPYSAESVVASASLDAKQEESMRGDRRFESQPCQSSSK